MNALEHWKHFLYQYIEAKQKTPWIALHAENYAVFCLQNLGGLMGKW